jgi:hypothetical protein
LRNAGVRDLFEVKVDGNDLAALGCAASLIRRCSMKQRNHPLRTALRHRGG